MSDYYHTYDELTEHEIEGVDYRVVVQPRKNPIAVLALHGGGIEPGTSEIASALAGDRYSLYLFDVLKSVGCEKLHLTSTRFDEPRGLELVHSSHWVLSIHGCTGSHPQVYLGGLDKEHFPLVSQLLKGAGFEVAANNPRYGASDPSNLCNQGQSGKGLQLELTKGLRRTFFMDLERRAGRKQTTQNFSTFVIALQQIVGKIEIEISAPPSKGR